MDTKQPITVFGLNPAWQKTLFFASLNKGEVNRAQRMTAMASGKGINFCRAAANWGQPTRLLQFLGGMTGNNIVAEMVREHIDAENIAVEAETRVCTTCLCLESGKTTELIEPSGKIFQAEVNELVRRCNVLLPNSSGFALCGTYPPGIGPEVYRDAAATANQLNIPVMLDSWKEIAPVLENGVTWLKINRDELLEMSGRTNIKTALKHCFDNYRISFIAITDGPDNAFLADRTNIWEYTLPRLEKVINPIGAGDTNAAVTFTEYLRGTDPVKAFAAGLAAASASCLTEFGAVYEPEKALELQSMIKITM